MSDETPNECVCGARFAHSRDLGLHRADTGHGCPGVPAQGAPEPDISNSLHVAGERAKRLLNLDATVARGAFAIVPRTGGVMCDEAANGALRIYGLRAEAEAALKEVSAAFSPKSGITPFAIERVDICRPPVVARPSGDAGEQALRNIFAFARREGYPDEMEIVDRAEQYVARLRALEAEREPSVAIYSEAPIGKFYHASWCANALTDAPCDCGAEEAVEHEEQLRDRIDTLEAERETLRKAVRFDEEDAEFLRRLAQSEESRFHHENGLFIPNEIPRDLYDLADRIDAARAVLTEETNNASD